MGATVSVTVNVILVVPELVKENVGLCAVGLLTVWLPVPPTGGDTVQLYCNANGTPLQEGGCEVLLEVTFNTEQPEVGVNMNAQVGGGMTQIVICSSSPPQPFAIVCVTVYVPGTENVTGKVAEPAVQRS